MRELKDRLRALELIQAPDLRDQIRGWEPPGSPTESAIKRVGVILVSFAIAFGGIALVVEAFR
ncbi:MAG: hypothetical protein WEE66_05480 [Actinomycetota bacterium]